MRQLFLCFLLLTTVVVSVVEARTIEVQRRLEEASIRSLYDAYIALQAWKRAITEDPLNITGNWVGDDVCSYRGVFCSPAPDGSCERVVTGIDLNHGYLSGTLPDELGLLTYLVLFHINTNFFRGKIPETFCRLTHLFELDLSNNRFTGTFPTVTLKLPSLKYLDVRFNLFQGPIPPKVFQIGLDAVFLNNNRFECSTPETIVDSTASVLVLANNMMQGTLPAEMGKLNGTLEEIILSGNMFTGCIPDSIGNLTQLTVLDLSDNELGGYIPDSVSYMKSLEQLNLADNLLSGPVPEGICELPHLKNLTLEGNFLTHVTQQCIALPSRGVSFDDAENCIPYEPNQRPTVQCADFYLQPVSCFPIPLLPLAPPVPPPPSPPPPPPPYVYKSPPPPPVYTYRSPPPPPHVYKSPPPPPPPVYKSPPPPPPPPSVFIYASPPPPPPQN